MSMPIVPEKRTEKYKWKISKWYYIGKQSAHACPSPPKQYTNDDHPRIIDLKISTEYNFHL